MKAVYVGFLLLLASLLPTAIPATAQPTVQSRIVITNLDTPWEILWGPDDWLWVTERPGTVSRIEPNTGQKVVILNPQVRENGEAGLLGMALHPNFADSPFVYIAYCYLGPGNSTVQRLVRYRYNGSTLVDAKTLLDSIAAGPTNDGGRVLITPDRKLWLATGDAGNTSLPQRHTSVNGKVLRMNLDGTAPADNPWSTARYPASLVWSTGHRNPQGLFLAPNGKMYLTEHAATADDELNIVVKGGNYGWPSVNGLCDQFVEEPFCADSHVVEPIRAWTGVPNMAGMDYYNHTAIPEWENSLLVVTLREADLRQIKFGDDGEVIFEENIFYDNRFGRLRDVCVAPDGRVFLGVSNRDGRAGPGFPILADDRIFELRGTVPAIVDVSTDEIDFDQGDSVVVRFVTNGTFNAGNVFTAQLSGPTGSFAQPRPLGVLQATSGGVIEGRLPCEMPEGINYRVRVVSTSPALVGPDNGVDLALKPRRAVIITPSGPTTFCREDSLVLTATSGYKRYRWNTGDTVQSITVRQAGAYSVTVTDDNDCGVVSQVLTLRQHPVPQPLIREIATAMLATDSGYATYQWNRDGEMIAGATGFTYEATQTGRYSVTITDSNGCHGTSAQIQIFVNAVPAEAPGGVKVYPQPAKDRITIELPLSHAGAIEMTLTDMSGAEVLRRAEEASGGLYRTTISLESIPAGAYVLHLRSGEQRWSTKVEVK